MILAAWEWYTVLFVVIWVLSSISDYKKRKRLKEQRDQQEAARRAAAQKAQQSTPSPTPRPMPSEPDSEESYPKDVVVELPQSHPQSPKTPAPITYRVDDEFKQWGNDIRVFEDEETGALQVAKPTKFTKLADREARQIRKEELRRSQVTGEVAQEENWARAFALGEALSPPLVKRPKRGASSRWI